MSYTVIFAPTAQDQIDAIEDYITLASGFRAVAVRYVEGIVGYCASLETFPERGMRRDDLLSGFASRTIANTR